MWKIVPYFLIICGPLNRGLNKFDKVSMETLQFGPTMS
jgi:hypothetical protein